MARGVNKVILLGNLGKDPDSKTFANGGTIATATVATSESWKGKDGTPQERTDWHNLSFNGKLAEIAMQYLRKGMKVYVEGKLRTREYEKDGQKRYVTEVVVSDFQMLDSRNSGAESSAPSMPAPMRAPKRAPTAEVAAEADPFMDDVPF